MWVDRDGFPHLTKNMVGTHLSKNGATGKNVPIFIVCLLPLAWSELLVYMLWFDEESKTVCKYDWIKIQCHLTIVN